MKQANVELIEAVQKYARVLNEAENVLWTPESDAFRRLRILAGQGNLRYRRFREESGQEWLYIRMLGNMARYFYFLTFRQIKPFDIGFFIPRHPVQINEGPSPLVFIPSGKELDAWEQQFFKHGSPESLEFSFCPRTRTVSLSCGPIIVPQCNVFPYDMSASLLDYLLTYKLVNISE